MKNFQHHFIEIPVPLGTDIYQVEIFNKEVKLTPTKLNFSNLGQVIDKWNIYFFDNKEYTENLIKKYNDILSNGDNVGWHKFISDYGAYYK